MARRRVVITGAAGYVAQRMYPELAERWDLVPIDVRPTTRAGKPVPGLIVSDLTRPDRNLYREHFRGADAVIHCGFVSAPNLDATTWQDNSDAKFWAEHANVALAYNVSRVALEEGVRRVVVCSSNHAADYYERLVWDGRLDMVTPEMPRTVYDLMDLYPQGGRGRPSVLYVPLRPGMPERGESTTPSPGPPVKGRSWR